MQFPKLFLGNVAWRFHHQILAPAVLGKCDNVANVGGPGDQHHQAVDAQCDPPMWGCPESKGAQQMPEEFLLLVRSNSQHIEHLCLKILLVNSDAATSNLNAV